MKLPSENNPTDRPASAYGRPEIYDIAFDFRDVPAEVDFLLEKARDILGRNVTSALELACGPAYHTREMARRRIATVGLDLEPRMAAYARSLVEKQMLASEIIHGDMRHFRLERRFDLVYVVLASFAHLLTNQDILDNLHCVADHLTDNGVYIVATAHPRDFYGDEESTLSTHWTMTRGEVTVETDWGGNDQKFDPLTEIDDVVITYKVTTPQGTQEYKSPERLRRLSIRTFEALVRLSGRFEIVDYYGRLDIDLRLTSDPDCWFFVPVLRKIK